MSSSARIVMAMVGIIVLVGLSPLPQNDSRQPAPPATQSDVTIDDLAWIAGRWVIEGKNKTIEEHWGKPIDNCMSGMLRWSRNGKAWLYEHIILEETEDGITMYLRHFSPAAKGWEEKDEPITATLAQLDGQRAVFARESDEPPHMFIYERRSETELRVRVGGTPEDQESGSIFVLTLAND